MSNVMSHKYKQHLQRTTISNVDIMSHSLLCADISVRQLVDIYTYFQIYTHKETSSTQMFRQGLCVIFSTAVPQLSFIFFIYLESCNSQLKTYTVQGIRRAVSLYYGKRRRQL